MPYLEREHKIGDEVVPKGTWVPERGWDRWQERAKGMRAPWREDMKPESLPKRLRLEAQAVLAADMASVQRDGFIYTNLIERLKDSPNDTTADNVVNQMKALGLASGDWPEGVGGPPSPQSPRPFKKVLDWLFKLKAQVTRFLMNCVTFVMTSLDSVSAVAVGVLPPSVSFEFPSSLFDDPEAWDTTWRFMDEMTVELGEPTFAP
jgi:hypothetical protein